MEVGESFMVKQARCQDAGLVFSKVEIFLNNSQKIKSFVTENCQHGDAV